MNATKMTTASGAGTRRRISLGGSMCPRVIGGGTAR
jgi:hypothetical protein